MGDGIFIKATYFIGPSKIDFLFLQPYHQQWMGIRGMEQRSEHCWVEYILRPALH
jgi:hypothetical protein